MWKNIELVSYDLTLWTLVNQYNEIEKKFWEVIWSKIWDYFPADFDKSLLNLDDMIANITKSSNESREWIHIAKIKSDNYGWLISDLYDNIKGIDGLQLDDFHLEVEGFNFRNDKKDFHVEDNNMHQINIRIKRESKLIDGQVIGEVKDTKSKTVNLLDN